MAFAPLSIDMYLPALPRMAIALRGSTAQAQYTLAAFFLGLSVGQLFYGPLTDRFGRKPPLYFGLALFTASSVGCALTNRLDALILLRLLQALGGCAGMVVARAMVRDLFDHQGSARILSTLMLVMGIAPILAPLLGSLLLAVLDWRAIFVFLACFGAACLSVSLRGLPESHQPDPGRPWHLAGILRTYARLLVDRHYLRHALASAMAWSGMFAYISASPFVFMQFHGLSAQAYGWVFGCNAAGLIACSQLNVRLLRRHSPERLLGWGYWAAAGLGLTLMVCVSVAPRSLVGLTLPLFGYIAVLGAIGPNASAGALRHHGDRAGAAAALLGTLQFALAAGIGVVMGALQNTTAGALAGVIAGCGCLSLALHVALGLGAVQPAD